MTKRKVRQAKQHSEQLIAQVLRYLDTGKTIKETLQNFPLANIDEKNLYSWISTMKKFGKQINYARAKKEKTNWLSIARQI